MDNRPLSEDEKWKEMSIGQKIMAIFIAIVILAAITFLAMLITPLIKT